MMPTPSAWQPLILCVLTVAAAFGLERLDPFPEDRMQVQPTPATLPSTRAVPARAVADGIPLLSLVVDREDLYDPSTGIIRHFNARGREWERTGYVSYFTDGRLNLATKTGVRLHGGDSRRYSKYKSFRLYFRSSYGPPALPSSIFFASQPHSNLTRIVAHNDVRAGADRRLWHLVNPLAYDIARRLGGIVPRTQPVRFYLNGESHGMYVLTEHISPEFLEARFGHRNFSIQRPGDSLRLRSWAARTRPFTMDVAAKVVDLDNLTSWALTVLFCATTDVLSQSPIVRDQSRPDGRWFWITWDLDHSFMDRYKTAAEPWLLDSYRTLLNDSEGRSRILTRLLRQDVAFRRYFSRRLAAALNHQLSPAFLEERYWHYSDIAWRGGIPDSGYAALMLKFLRERPRVLWALSARHLKTGPPVTVTVSGPPGSAVTVDGFRTTLPYSGIYLPGTPFDLDVSDGSISGWRVNGRNAESRVSFVVRENVRIDSVSRSN